MTCLHTSNAKANDEPIVNYAPIASCLITMQECDQARMRCKFDWCYLMAKEGIAFEKFPKFCEMEERHGTMLMLDTPTGQPPICAIIYAIHSRSSTAGVLSKKHFYSVLMDGSTDAGKLK